MNLEQFKGSWALVTGASAGIGREFAQQLAARGMHVVLVARRADLLRELATEIAARHGVQAVPIPLDLGEPGAATRLVEALAAQALPVRLLVNNAAIGRWGRFEDTDPDTYQSLMALNTVAPMMLCRALLPELATRAPCAVVNLSSPAALQPVPFMAVYAASKVYLHSLSLALHEEWRGRGVYVQTLVPGPTATEFDLRAGAYPSALGAKREPPQVAVDAALRAFASEKPLVVAASGTYAQRVFAALAPARFVLSKVGQMFRPPG